MGSRSLVRCVWVAAQGERGRGRWDRATLVSPLLSDACVAVVEGNEEEKDREEREDCGWASLA